MINYSYVKDDIYKILIWNQWPTKMKMQSLKDVFDIISYRKKYPLYNFKVLRKAFIFINIYKINSIS